jgi:hypothetical protein
VSGFVEKFYGQNPQIIVEIICEGNINKFFVKAMVLIRWCVAGFKGQRGCAAGAGLLL